MFSTHAAPQWALASRENGFSYLSWKRKTLLAATVIICGGGLAAQFPNTSASFEPAAVSSNSALSDIENAPPLLVPPQDRYANNAQTPGEENQPSFARPGEQLARYVEPPAMSQENQTENSLLTSQKPPARRVKMFESIDDSGFKKMVLDLPLAKWNPRFDQAPPLSERPLQPLIDENEIVPAGQETVQAMKPAESETFIHPVIDSAQLVPAEEHEITVVIQEDCIVPASEDFSDLSPDEITPVISDDQIRPASEE